MRSFLAFVCCLTIASTGIQKPAKADVDYHGLTEQLVTTVIIPDYENFASAARILQQAFGGASCTDLPSHEAGFHTVMDAWQRVAHIRFGPVMNEDRFYRVQFWPDKRNITSRHLAGLLENPDPASRSVEGIIAASVAVQGLPALERLLFDRKNEGGLNMAQCELATSIATNIATIATEIAEEWRNSYRQIMLRPGPDNPEYLNDKEVMKKLHGALSTSLQLIVQAKLMPVLGKSKDNPKPKLSESWRSSRSIRNILINIETAHRLYEGGGAHAIGFDDILLQRGGQEEHAVIAGGMRQAMKWVEEIDRPVLEITSVSSGYSKMALVAGQLAAVRSEIDGQLVDALGLSLGFNALDGD